MILMRRPALWSCCCRRRRRRLLFTVVKHVGSVTILCSLGIRLFYNNNNNSEMFAQVWELSSPSSSRKATISSFFLDNDSAMTILDLPSIKPSTTTTGSNTTKITSHQVRNNKISNNNNVQRIVFSKTATINSSSKVLHERTNSRAHHLIDKSWMTVRQQQQFVPTKDDVSFLSHRNEVTTTTVGISPNGCPNDLSTITTWDEVQRCINGRHNSNDNNKNNQQSMQQQQQELLHNKYDNNNNNKRNKNKKQRYLIRLVGERHSGTKFIIGVIRSCFRSVSRIDIDVNRDFTRSKHFFQVPPHPPDHPRIIAKKYRYDDLSHVIVVAVVRNPYDWVHAMIQQPYHTPYHVARFPPPNHNNNGDGWPIPLPWQEYVTRPWSMPRSTLDLQRMAQNDINGNICTLGMRFDEVVPCEIRPHELPEFASYREHIPVYELKRDGSGQPFDHVLDMRAAKIRHTVLEIPTWLQPMNDGGGNGGNYMVVRYDDLLVNGTEHMLHQIAQMVGLPSQLPNQCMPKGPQPERIGKRQIPPGLRTWIHDHMDVKAEQLIGYHIWHDK